MKRLIKIKHSLSIATCTLVLSIFSLSQGVEAKEINNKKEAVVHKGGMGFEARIGVGYLQGEATSWVYNTQAQSRAESKLPWTLDSVLMVGGGITFKPVSWLTLNADVWTKVSGNSEMTDWDWIYDGGEWKGDWTHWSHTDPVSLEDGQIIDLNASIPVYKTPKLTVHGLVGYLRDHWSWDGTGGTTHGIYSSDATVPEGFRDHIWTEQGNGANGITYEQTFDTPYLGIGFGLKLNPITVNAKVIGSTFVNAEDYDHHLSRDLRFYGDFGGDNNMIGMTCEVVYDLTKSLSLGATVNYVNYSPMTGDVDNINDANGERYTTAGTAGTELQRTSLNLSLAYRF